MSLFNAPDHVEKLSAEVTAYYAIQSPENKVDRTPALLIAIHGWGQNAPRFLRDFAPLKSRNIVVAAPQGMHQFYLDAGTKKVGFNWLTVYDRQQAIADTNAFFVRLMAQVEKSTGYDAARIFILGFSQGSAMAWRFAVSKLVRPAGLISIGADLPADVVPRLEQAPDFPALLLRGKDDPLAPPELIAHGAETLNTHGRTVQAEEYEGEHRITPELVVRIGDWIEACPQAQA